MKAVRSLALLVVASAALLLGACAPKADSVATPAIGASVDSQRLRNAAAEPQNWLMDGRTYDAQRYSPLKAINEQNVGELGLAWYYDLDDMRGVEGTPLVRRRRHLQHQRVEHHVCARCGDRQAAVALRSEGAARVGSLCLLRTGRPRSRVLETQRDHRHARRPADLRSMRRPARRSWTTQTFDKNCSVLDHRRAAGVRRQGRRRQRRGRPRRAWLRRGVRRGYRQGSVALLDRAGRSVERLRERGDGNGREDLDRASGGSSAAAVRRGIRSPTTPT